MASRHLARSIAMQTLYEWDFNGRNSVILDKVLNRDLEEFGPGLDEVDFVKQIVNGVMEHLPELDKIIENTAKNIDNFEFGQALHELYDFFWHEFCDKYLESSKVQVVAEEFKQNTQKILLYVLSTALKLMHPFIPHITEEVWSKIPAKEKLMLIIEKWPTT